jgi:ribonuclease MRP protein subunit RMP1
MATIEKDAPEKAQALLNTLRPLQPVLAGFAHRNRNQHHGARWWAEFGMLRRQVGRLVLELQEGLGDVRNDGKKEKRRDRGAVAVAVAMDRALDRTIWLRDVSISRCYLYGFNFPPHTSSVLSQSPRSA